MKKDNIDNYMTRKHRDYSSVESRKKVLSERFRKNTDYYLRSRIVKNPDDNDRNRLQRRMKAAETYMEEALSLYEKYCPQIDDVFYPVEDYADICSVPVESYDDLGRGYNLIEGAADWILDELERADHLSSAIDLFGDFSERDLEMLRCQNVSYSYETVSGIIHILKSRNDDCTGYRSKKDMKRYWTDDLTVRDKQHQSVPSRKRYEALLDLIPQERKQKAVDLFERKVREAFIVYLKCRQIITVKQDRITMQIDRTLRRIKNYEHNEKAYQSDDRSGMPLIINDETIERNHQLIAEDSERLNRFYDQSDEQASQFVALQNGLPEILGEETGWMPEDLDEEIKKMLSSFKVEDPFALCFACLYLIDQNSDLPWMFTPCIAVMSRTGMTLPWYVDEYDEDQDPVCQWKEGDPVLRELPDVNDPVYHEKNSDPESVDYAVTLNQIICELCGDRFPGNLDHFGPLEKELDNFDLNEKERLFVLTSCIAFYSADHLIDYSPLITNILDHLDGKKEQNEPETTDSLQQIIREQKQELEALQTTAHRLQRMYTDQYRKYQKLEAKSEEDTKELAELREIFFHQNNDIQEEEKISVTLPYEVKQNTTVFGGFPAWQKEIVKDLTGNIRFIDTNKGYDEHIIHHSECIWLQTNAMSHSDFYKIVNAARKYHIPFHYFQYASAQKCARQVAEREQETL